MAELTKNTHPDALLPFTDYIEKWLNSTRPSLATTTYQSYSSMIKARILPYFKPMELQLMEVTPQHIEDFYQTILNDDCTTNTVIHYHAILRKAMQVAVKKISSRKILWTRSNGLRKIPSMETSITKMK